MTQPEPTTLLSRRETGLRPIFYLIFLLSAGCDKVGAESASSRERQQKFGAHSSHEKHPVAGLSKGPAGTKFVSKKKSPWPPLWGPPRHFPHPPRVCRPNDPPTPPACTWQPWGTGIQAIGVTDAEFNAAGTAWAVAGSRVYQSTDLGETWTELADLGERIREIELIGPTEDNLLAFSGSGSYVSSDGGSSWEPGTLSGFGVASVSQSPVQPQTMFAYSAGAGILRSGDQGKTWGGTREDRGEVAVFSIALDHSDARHALAAGIPIDGNGRRLSEGVLFETVDGGISWQTARTAGPATDVSQCTGNAATWVAGMGPEVVRSDDGGKTWAAIATFERDVSSTTFLGHDCQELLIHAQGLGFFRSTDGGSNWSESENDGLTFPAHFRFALHNEGEVIVTHDQSGSGAYRSTDRGRTWQALPALGYIDLRGLQVVGSKVLLGTWGAGAWSIDTDAATWSQLAAEPAFNFFVTAPSEQPEDLLVGGWPRLFRSTDGGQLEQVSDTYFNAVAAKFDADDPQHVVMAVQSEGVLESVDGGLSWANITANLELNGSLLFVTSLGFSPEGVLHAATNGGKTFRRDSDGQWNAFGGELSHGASSQLIFEGPEPFLLIYGLGVARLENDLWVTQNEGLPSLSPADIVYDELSQRYLLGLANEVFYWENTWKPLQFPCPLPDRVAKLDLLAGDPPELLVGTASSGVFRTWLSYPDD